QLPEPHGVEAQDVTELDLLDEVLVALTLGVTGRTRQLIEETKTHGRPRRSDLAPVSLNLARHGTGALRYPGRRVLGDPLAATTAGPPGARKGHGHGLGGADFLHALLGGARRARPRAGGARLRVARGARALPHPALPPVAVSPGWRLAEEVLRRHGSVRDAG